LHDKSRGFCLDNIYKITKAELTMKVIQTGTKMMRPVHTPAGDFPSIASAGRHHGMQSMQVIYRINKPKHVDWYYIDKKGEQQLDYRPPSSTVEGPEPLVTIY